MTQIHCIELSLNYINIIMTSAQQACIFIKYTHSMTYDLQEAQRISWPPLALQLNPFRRSSCPYRPVRCARRPEPVNLRNAESKLGGVRERGMRRRLHLRLWLGLWLLRHNSQHIYGLSVCLPRSLHSAYPSSSRCGHVLWYSHGSGHWDHATLCRYPFVLFCRKWWRSHLRNALLMASTVSGWAETVPQPLLMLLPLRAASARPQRCRWMRKRSSLEVRLQELQLL